MQYYVKNFDITAINCRLENVWRLTNRHYVIYKQILIDCLASIQHVSVGNIGFFWEKFSGFDTIQLDLIQE